MALNINWRFAGPQNINVPQSNFLNSLDKNIQNALGIKKEFDKKRDDNEMIRLMTEDAEKKLADAIKTNDIEKIKAAEKELADARMSANQFKTTGTTDFFRWKKDKEYASDVAAINREMLNEQIKQEKLSDLSEQIKRKQFELDNSNNKDEKKKLANDLKLLKEQYNKLAGQTVYAIDDSTTLFGAKPKVGAAPNGGDIKDVDYINKEIESLTWQENLAESDAVKQIQDEINNYSDSIAEDKLNQDLTFKIKKLNDDKAAEVEAERKAKEAKAEAARKAREKIENDLLAMRNDGEAKNLLTYANNPNNNKEFRDQAEKYLIEVLNKIPTGLSETNKTRARAAKSMFPNDKAMHDFIDKRIDAIK